MASDAAVFRRVEQPTLFFLPHCASSMYHNLLAANWTQEALPKLALLGNSFVTIAEKWHDMPAKTREGKPEPRGILDLVAAHAVVDVPVKECNFPVRGAFNDMSVILFPSMPHLDQLEPLSLDHLLPSSIM